MYYVDSVINGKSEAYGFSIFHQANRRLECRTFCRTWRNPIGPLKAEKFRQPDSASLMVKIGFTNRKYCSRQIGTTRPKSGRRANYLGCLGTNLLMQVFCNNPLRNIRPTLNESTNQMFRSKRNNL